MRRDILHVTTLYIFVNFWSTYPSVHAHHFFYQQQFGELFSYSPEGQECILANGETGTCKRLEDCPYQVENYYNRTFEAINQERCGFIEFTEIVCCPPVNPKKVLEPSSVCQGQKCVNVLKIPQRYFIVHGIRAVEKEFSYLAVLAYHNRNRPPGDPEYMYVCGGILISPRHVLTAAHCVKNRDKFIPHHVLLGAIDLLFPGPNSQRIQIDRIATHPEYRSNLVYKDVAVLSLKSKATITSSVKPIRLHSVPIKSTPTGNAEIKTLGFGVTEVEELSSLLLKTHNLGIVPKDECQQWYGNNMQMVKYGLDDTLICARDFNTTRNSDACTGDSGGPLVLTSTVPTEPHTLIGLTAFGQDCGDLSPGVYTAVFPYLDWIEQFLWSDRASRSYSSRFGSSNMTMGDRLTKIT